MTENPELNRFVRSALEAGGAFALHPRRTARVWKWAVPSLLAASVALVVAVSSVFSRAADPLSETIGLLSAIDGLDGVMTNAETPGEMLLAWQDAPCSEVL